MSLNKKCSSMQCKFCLVNSFDYNQVLANKNKEIQQIYGRYKDITDSVVPMEDPYHYRHKVTATFKMKKDVISAGLYQEGSHDIIVAKDCLLQHQLANQIIKTVVALANDFKLTAFNERSGYGLLRHIQIRVGHYSKEVLVTLVLGEKVFKSRNNFIKILVKKHPEIKTVVSNFNYRKTSVVLGENELVSYGPGFIYDRLCGFKFQISSKSFYQINPVQTEKLYLEAIKLAEIKDTDIVLDTYSGIGTISIIAAKYAKEVVGIELNERAVNDANKNKRNNNVANVKFICADVNRYVTNYKGHVDILIMDPTRHGSDEEFLKAVKVLKPAKIIYISCNPKTQARDIKMLTDEYKLASIKPFDMFPFTDHVEVVIQMMKR